MIHRNYLRNLYIKLLREAKEEDEWDIPEEKHNVKNIFSDKDIAFYEYEEGNDLKEGTAYKCKDIIEIISKNVPIDEYGLWKLCDQSIVGFIRIIKSREPCHGAWEVTRAAGPGQGKLVYAMGYHMSPTGRIMSDRSSVSDDARDAWKKAGKKSEGLPFDDIYDKKTPQEEDDCLVYSDEKVEALNKAYEMGDMGYNFNSMINNHNKVANFIQKSFNISIENFESNLHAAGEPYFKKYYHLHCIVRKYLVLENLYAE